MIVLDTHIVPNGIVATRLSDYAVGIFPAIPSKKGIGKAIKRGEVLVNNIVAGTGKWINPGDVIVLQDLQIQPPKTLWLKIPVIYEDNFLAVIHKPAGIVVSGNQYRTIQNALAFNLTESDAVDALKWAKPVHRLDALTSGLLLIAKTHTAYSQLAKQFEEKTIKKHYQAIVIGQAPKNGEITIPIDRKNASTYFECQQTVSSLKSGHLSLLNLYPHTGRTHQLRKHCAESGFPILGDQLYGIPTLILKGKGLFLSAIGLTFEHPISKEPTHFQLPTPNKFLSRLKQEQRRWNNYKT